jgi:phosphatidylserine/phosphatidylglycerophosphate/cardiolipin synthase-like enzyme
LTRKSNIVLSFGCAALAVGAAGISPLSPDRAQADARKGLIVTPDAGARLPAKPTIISVRAGKRAKLFRARLNGEPIGRYFGDSRRGARKVRASGTYGLRFGKNRLRVKVRRRSGEMRSRRTRFRVRRNNPLAAAGLDRRGVVGRRIVLRGGRSDSHPTGGPSDLTYDWDLVSTPTGGHRGASLRPSDSPRASFRPATAGTYRIKLTVTASDGESGSDAVVLDVVPKGPEPPTEPPHIAAVTSVLRDRNKGTEGTVWGLSQGNTLPGEGNTLPGKWLLQTPNCWGMGNCGPGPLPPSGKPITDRITQLIAGAQQSVDFSGLWPPPDGAFRQAIVDGLKQAIAAGHTPTLRVLLGTPPTQYSESAFQKWFDGLVADVGGNLPVQAVGMSTYKEFGVATSWNHSKVIAVDGKSAIVGGMNYWAGDYLQVTDPVNDVSITVNGPAATDVVKFDDVLWGWICDHRTQSAYVAFKSSNVSGCVSTAKTLSATPRGDVPILTVGRLGNGIDVPGHPDGDSGTIPKAKVQGSACTSFQRQISDTNTNSKYEYRNPGENALRALIGSATKSVFLSQQDLLGCIKNVEALFDERVFAALGDKIAAGIPVTIVLSDEGAKSNGGDYSNGWTMKDVAQNLTKVVAASQGSSAADARKTVCNGVSLAQVRTLDANKWPNGSPFANHAKLVSVDDAAFYVGSENLYPARLQELGMIVESPTASSTLRREYLDPLWSTAASRAFIDPSRSVCGQF